MIVQLRGMKLKHLSLQWVLVQKYLNRIIDKFNRNDVVDTNHSSIFILITCFGGVNYKGACVDSIGK